MSTKRTIGKFFLISAIAFLSLTPFSIKTTYAAAGTTPEQYGANAYDQTDDTAALQAAINTGLPVTLKANGTYYISSRLVVKQSLTMTSDVQGSRANIVVRGDENKGATYFENKARVTSTPYEPILARQNYIRVNDAPLFKVGDIIEIKSNILWPEDNRGYLTKGEIHQVTRISGRILYFSGSTASYTEPGETLKVYGYEAKTHAIRDISFSYETPHDATMITVEPSVDSQFTNIHVKNSKLLGIQLRKNVSPSVTYSEFDLGTTPEVATGYGIQDYGSIDGAFHYNTLRNLRRGIDISGEIPSRGARVYSNKAYGPPKGTLAAGNSGYGTHTTARNVVFRNNYSYGFYSGYVLRGININVENATHEGDSTAFAVIAYGSDVTFTNNNAKGLNGGLLPYFLYFHSTYQGTVNIPTPDNNIVSAITYSNRSL